jgi:hypothetical protein
MFVEDWTPDWYPEDEERPVTCKRCGAEDLFWEYISRRWRLVSYDGEPHGCVAQPGEFPPV